jgi:hypothetical protein
MVKNMKKCVKICKIPKKKKYLKISSKKGVNFTSLKLLLKITLPTRYLAGN